MKKTTFEIALELLYILTKLLLIVLAIYFAFKANYLAAISIWLQLIYFKILDFKK